MGLGAPPQLRLWGSGHLGSWGGHGGGETGKPLDDHSVTTVHSWCHSRRGLKRSRRGQHPECNRGMRSASALPLPYVPPPRAGRIPCSASPSSNPSPPLAASCWGCDSEDSPRKEKRPTGHVTNVQALAPPGSPSGLSGAGRPQLPASAPFHSTRPERGPHRDPPNTQAFRAGPENWPRQEREEQE